MTRSRAAQSSTHEPIGRRPPIASGTRRSDRTREALLAQCLQLFAARGFSSTSVDDIASAAGVTKGAMYWHFTSKDEIFHAILDRIRDRWRTVVHASVSARSDPIAQLEQMFDAYAAMFRESPDVCLFLQQVLLDRQNTRYGTRVTKVFASTARFIAGIVDAGKAQRVMRGDVDSLTIAYMILGLLAGAGQQAATNRARTLEQLINEAKAMTLARLTP